MLKVQIAKNLRRELMRGHPWIYRLALKNPPQVDKSQMCQVLDTTGEALGWAMYDPNSALAVRMLSLDKHPPKEADFNQRMSQALQLRSQFLKNNTNCYRLFNGEGDLLPGLVCDNYAHTAVLQFDGEGPAEFWDKDQIAGWILKNSSAKTVVEKLRPGKEKSVIHIAGEPFAGPVSVLENAQHFEVNIELGQKTGFFLDQRDNRHYLGQQSQGKKVLNLFSYTGGFSIYAGGGGASQVCSVDISKGALAGAELNWKLNRLPSSHTAVAADVFEFLQNEKNTWDTIIVDPPSMAHSEKQKDLAINKYIELFVMASKRVPSSGNLVLSSCSSHISFNDFFEIINQTLSKSRRRGQILRVSGQGADHPYLHACPEMRYLKFVHLVLS